MEGCTVQIHLKRYSARSTRSKSHGGFRFVKPGTRIVNPNPGRQKSKPSPAGAFMISWIQIRLGSNKGLRCGVYCYIVVPASTIPASHTNPLLTISLRRCFRSCRSGSGYSRGRGSQRDCCTSCRAGQEYTGSGCSCSARSLRRSKKCAVACENVAFHLRQIVRRNLLHGHSPAVSE